MKGRICILNRQGIELLAWPGDQHKQLGQSGHLCDPDQSRQPKINKVLQQHLLI